MTAISEALKLEAGHFGIRVFAIEPGVIETSFGANALNHRAEPGPYEELGVLWTKAQEILGGGQAAPGPELVATTIAAALESDGSRLRWPVGQDAELDRRRAQRNRLRRVRGGHARGPQPGLVAAMASPLSVQRSPLGLSQNPNPGGRAGSARDSPGGRAAVG